MKLFVVCVTLVLLASNVELRKPKPKKVDPKQQLMDSGAIGKGSETGIDGTWGNLEFPIEGIAYAGEISEPPVIQNVDVEEEDCGYFVVTIIGIKDGDENATLYGAWLTEDVTNYLEGCCEFMPYSPPPLRPGEKITLATLIYAVKGKLDCFEIEGAENTASQDIMDQQLGICSDPIALEVAVFEFFINLEDYCEELE